MLVFLCSPHRDGVTDRLGIAAAGCHAGEIVAVRDYAIAGCRGCGFCVGSSGCVLPPDGADELFGRMARANTLVFAAPIYFYALPGQFKLFIDRSQKYWAAPESPGPERRAGVILAAGRKKGEKLFAGSLLTLKWFLKSFGFRISETAVFRGMDSVADLTGEALAQAELLGSRLTANE